MRHQVGSGVESLSGLGFDGRGAAAMMGAHPTAPNCSALASVPVLAVRGATMRPHFGFGVSPPLFAPLDDRCRCRKVVHGFIVSLFRVQDIDDTARDLRVARGSRGSSVVGDCEFPRVLTFFRRGSVRMRPSVRM
jgi:hypothetical protein